MPEPSTDERWGALHAWLDDQRLGSAPLPVGQAWMEQTNRVALAREPRFIVWGGDLAYADALPERLYRWEEWFAANKNTLIDVDGFVTPVVVGIGNHEVQRGYYRHHDDFQPIDAWRARIAPYFFSIFAFPGQPGYDVLDFGDYLSLVVLDSDHANPISGEQADWLDATLAQRRHVPHVLPVYHVPAYPSHRSYDGGTSRRVREHWVPLFEKHGVQLAIENHDHAYKRTEPIYAGQVDPQRGLTYIGDGAWGVNVRPVHDVEDTWYLRQAKAKRHAIIVTLTSGSRRVEVLSEDGKLIDAFPE